MTERSRIDRARLIAGAVIVALGAALLALVIHNRRADDELAHQLYVPHHSRITPEAALLQQYIRIDTSNPPGREEAGARWLAAQLAAGGVRAEIIDSAPGRSNVYARIRGKRTGDGLLLLSHIDVVPATNGKGWSRPPFSGSIAANMIYGRGAADMKGIGICDLSAFLDVARSGRTPEVDLVFLAVADEENESEQGIRWLIQHRRDVLDGIRYVLNEGGITEVQKETLTYFGIEIGAKEVTDLELVAPTREQLQRTRIALEPYFHPPDPAPVRPGIRNFFKSVAPRRVQFSSLLADVDKTIAEGKFWLLPITYRDLLQNTIWAGGVRADGNRFAMRVVLLNLPGEDPDQRIAWLTGIVKPMGAAVGRIDRKEGPIPMSPDDTPLFAVLRREVKAQYKDAAVGPEALSASTSDSRFLRPMGLVCYGFQPFPLDYFQTLGVHGVNERVRLDWYASGVELTRRVVNAYVFSR